MKDTMTFIRGRLLGATTALVTLFFTATDARAQDSGGQVADCIDAVGTYLTNNSGRGEHSGHIARSLVSLTNGGHAFLTDSNEEGIRGFAPFGETRGAWRCLSNEDGVAHFQATMFHFTRATPSFPEQKIGRLDIDGFFDTKNESLSGTMVLFLLPMDSDPLGKIAAEKALEGPFTGQKVIAP